MIKPDAKCVVNGKKVNEVIQFVNDLLKIANSAEEFDVVEQGNISGKRWFLTGNISGQKQGSAAPDRDTLGGHGGAGEGDNRNQLNGQAPLVQAPRGQGGVVAGGVTISNAQGRAGTGPQPIGALLDTGTSGRPPAPTGALRDTGTSGIPLAPSTALRDTGTTAGTRGEVGGPATDEFGNVLGSGNVGMPVAPTAGTGADTTPLPGAPPRTGEPTRDRGARSAVKAGPGSHRADELRRRGLKKRKQELFNRSPAKKLMDHLTAKRQKEADRQARINQMGGKYSPYARGPR